MVKHIAVHLSVLSFYAPKDRRDRLYVLLLSALAVFVVAVMEHS
jgi:hypothetical protein